jgi:hypothetical protein
MFKFPSIVQFKDVVKRVRDYSAHTDIPLPTLDFYGTVKLHGTNAGITQEKANSNIYYQSRERVITPESDNAGFATYMSQIPISYFFENIRKIYGIYSDSRVTVFGEWCGGNIQKGVALNQLNKMFVIFAIQVENYMIYSNTIPPALTKGTPFYVASEFQTFFISIDFNKPEEAQNKLLELTLKVEEECPVGKSFDVSGVGEGIVWNCVIDNNLVFKTKGEKHSVSKVKTLIPVDIEKVESLKVLADSVMTQNRMQQMFDELETKDLGLFIKKCLADVYKEEKDVIELAGFTDKEFQKACVAVVKQFYFSL